MPASDRIPIRVLLVDDQGCMREILRRLLNQVGIHNIGEACDGEDAYAVLEDANIADPDVIICDLHMKNIGGIEFCNLVRRNKEMAHRGIPILILTGDTDEFLHDVSQQVGAAGVIMKPVSAPDLRRRIEGVVGYSGTTTP